MLEEQVLDPLKHDRQSFSCGVAALDEYLQRLAIQQSKKGISVVRVLVDTEHASDILGYYTLSAAQVDTSQLDPQTQQKLPRYPVPCFRLGRLATHLSRRGQGIGRLLIGCAVDRCREARRQVAGYALIVDAKGEEAKRFYLHYGFIPCQDHSMTLYLPLGQ
ncbi:MAG: hypothetical protein RIR18_2229 [Pseudomonadota bacterium]